MSDCNICAEKFNKNNRTKITCHCEFEVCRSCGKIYILDKIEDAHCMNCKIKWDRKFMADNFDKTFMSKSYRDHREQILIEREMGMLQATQPYVEREIKLEKLNVAMIRLRINYENDMKILQDKIQVASGSSATVEHKKFIRKCPNGECHGFLSSSLKCKLCENYSCSDCREITGKKTEERDAHTCDPQIIKSVKLLEKDSKPCPKCASLTFKSTGCNSMWCIECHSSWNWISGKIETGTIHNPEYFDWLKKQNKQVPRNPLDFICGREIDNIFIMQLSKTKKNFVEIARNIIHISHVEILRFQVGNRLEDNLQMRIDFMRNKIDKKDLKKKIQKKEKENEKKLEISNVLNMYKNCMTDIFYRLMADSEQNTIKNEMNALRIYVNESLKRISNTYNCKTYEINKNFVFC